MQFRTTLIELETNKEHIFSHTLDVFGIEYYVTIANVFLRDYQFIVKENDLVE